MNVFVVEDSDAVRGHLQHMLSDIPGVELIGYAKDEQGAIESIDKLLPDVVILDIRLQPGSGIAVLENIKNNHAMIKVIVLTNYIDEFYADYCKNAGADCFFDKTFQFSRVRSALWSWVYADGAGGMVKAESGEMRGV